VGRVCVLVMYARGRCEGEGRSDEMDEFLDMLFILSLRFLVLLSLRSSLSLTW